MNGYYLIATGGLLLFIACAMAARLLYGGGRGRAGGEVPAPDSPGALAPHTAATHPTHTESTDTHIPHTSHTPNSTTDTPAATILATPAAQTEQPIPDDEIARVVARSGANPERLARAKQLARERWPEFVSAFAARTKGQMFGVKARFEEFGISEELWVQVVAMEGETLSGVLSDAPAEIRDYEQGDKVTVKAADVVDWVYSDRTGKKIGGFTTRRSVIHG